MRSPISALVFQKADRAVRVDVRNKAQRAVQPQGSPKDDMFGDFSRRAQTRYEPSLQLLIGKRRDCTLEGFLVVLPTFEDTRLGYCCSCHLLYSKYVCVRMADAGYPISSVWIASNSKSSSSIS